MQTRASVQLPEKSQSETNPELITNWENLYTIVLNTIGNGNTKVSVIAPWAMGAATTGLPYEFCTDIKKEDGWAMLFHTFRAEGLEPGLNYMVFYNLFTGFFKVFYYCEGGTLQSTSVNWSLKCGNSQLIQHSLLEMVDVLTPVEGEFAGNPDGVESGLRFNNFLVNQSFTAGWNGFQFQVSRYEDYPRALSLALGGESVTITNYDFNGSLESSIEGNITSYSSKVNDVVDGIVNLTGNGASKLLGKIKDKHIVTENGKPKNSFLGKVMSSAFEILSAGNISGALMSGLKFFFGKSLIVTTPTTQEVKLTQTGKIVTSGKSITIQNSSFSTLRFNLKELFNPESPRGSEVVNPDFLDSDFTGLGVWTVPYTPIVYYNPVTRYVPTYICESWDGRETDIEGFTAYPSISDYDVDVVFNPMIERYLKDYSIKVDFTETDLFTEHDYGSSIIILSGNYLMDNHLYYPEVHHERLVMKAKVKPNEIQPNLRYFYQWDNPGNRRTVAMITVEMEINYKGHEFTVQETRAYRTESFLDYGNFFPPSNSDRAVLINNLNPRIISTSFQGSVPPYEP